jgi:RNA polymerase sigma factor (sigma-70 family)
MPADDNITGWIVRLKEGDPRAAQVLWEAYFRRIVALARQLLGLSNRRVEDEEDVAICVFNSVYQRAAAGRFPQLNDRHDFWRLLVTISERKASSQRRFHRRQKRGGGQVRGESAFLGSGESYEKLGIANVAAPDPTPELVAAVAETCRDLLSELPNDTLRGVALRKMEGFTNDEIAQQLGCKTRTVERKLRLIREHWSRHTVDEDG